jgi:hypothetical protein
MKTTLMFVTAALMLLGMGRAANAFEMCYRLEVNQTTWVLKGITDAPGGIASFVVDLVGVATGVSDAPRGTFGGGAVNGFTLGNVFAANQAFAGQTHPMPRRLSTALAVSTFLPPRSVRPCRLP